MTTTMASHKRFDWEEAVLQDHDLHRIDTHVQLTISKLPGELFSRVNAGRGGSHFEPSVPPSGSNVPPPSGPTVPPSGPIVQTTPRPIMSTATLTGIPQFINPRDYQSESSSEFDTREVNPMDELSDFESETLQQHQDQDQTMDVVMEEGEEGEEEEEEGQAIDDDEKQQNHHIQCPICKRVDREKEGIVCGKCHVACHICCLDPPLAHVSQNTWYCATCKLEPSIGGTGIHVKNVQPAMAHENVTRRFGVNSETIRTRQSVERDDVPAREATSLSIAQVLGGDPNKSNLLLIHACNCDQIECTDDEFRVICLHMKRFLRSVCWASHSDKWRSYRLAQITTELFAYHAMNCKVSQCNVPLCVKIREEEIV